MTNAVATIIHAVSPVSIFGGAEVMDVSAEEPTRGSSAQRIPAQLNKLISNNKLINRLMFASI
jgi:hypothetical protein